MWGRSKTLRGKWMRVFSEWTRFFCEVFLISYKCEQKGFSLRFQMCFSPKKLSSIFRAKSYSYPIFYRSGSDIKWAHGTCHIYLHLQSTFFLLHKTQSIVHRLKFVSKWELSNCERWWALFSKKKLKEMKAM